MAGVKTGANASNQFGQHRTIDITYVALALLQNLPRTNQRKSIFMVENHNPKLGPLAAKARVKESSPSFQHKTIEINTNGSDL